MNGNQVKRGLRVHYDGGIWVTLDRSPKPVHWWLHRWVNGTWETTEAHASELTHAG